MTCNSFSRRSLLEAAVRLAATPLGASFFRSWASAAEVAHSWHSDPPPPAPKDNTWDLDNYQPLFFESEDYRALSSFAEILIPTDETPGARDARCAQFIDFTLNSLHEYAPETQQQWRAALLTFRRCGFHTASSTEQRTLVHEMSRPEFDPTAHHEAFEAYRLMKHETVWAFYTSRAGLVETLDYRGNSYNLEFPACQHPEHHQI